MSRRTEQQIVDDVLEHWYGAKQLDRLCYPSSQTSLWYKGTKEIDDDIRDRFGDDVELALDGRWDQLIGGTEHPLKGELALVIMLDQYTRNIFRGSAKAFAGDEKAFQAAAAIVSTDRWADAKQNLAIVQCTSLLLPFMHQEHVEHLDTCSEKVEDLIAEVEPEGEQGEEVLDSLRKMVDYTKRHRDIIVEYGRYPYRNQSLGRTSTPEELTFLETGPRFGQ